MRKTDSMKDMMLVKKIKAEDPVELPMDEAFFDALHDKIMMAVEKTEIKPVSKWEKTWVFLEQKTIATGAKARSKLKKYAKPGLTVFTIAIGLGFLNLAVNMSEQYALQKLNANKNSILSEAQKNPTEWAEFAVHYQDENDFYADILSQRGSETIVEIDKVISQSL